MYFNNNRFKLDEHAFYDDKKLIESTTTVKNIYVATTGSDLTGDGTAGNPYKTIQKAIDTLPDFINYSVNINIGPGTFNENISFTKRTTSSSTELSVNQLFVFFNGSSTEIVPEQTATAGSNNTITVAGAGWTPNAYQEKFILITGGTGFAPGHFNNYFPILSNTADTLTLPKTSTTLNNTTKFKIVYPSTILRGLSSLTNVFRTLCDPNIWTFLKSCVIENTGGVVTTTNSTLWLQGCHANFSSGQYYAVSTSIDSYLFVDGCIFEGNFIYANIWVYDRSRGLIRYNWIKDNSSAGDRKSGILAELGSNITMFGNHIENCHRGIFADINSSITVGSSATSYNYINNCTYALAAGGFSSIDAIYSNGSGNTNITVVENESSIEFNNSNLTGTNVVVQPVNGSVINYSGGNLIKYINERYTLSQAVADENYIDLPTGITGDCYIIAGDNEEYVNAHITSTGSVIVNANSTNVAYADTDGNLCIYDNGTNVRIKNRLGASKTIKIRVEY